LTRSFDEPHNGAMLDRVESFAMTPAEREALARDGFVLREAVFDAAECAAIAADCEELVRQLYAASRGKKRALGSYMFEAAYDIETIIKWEPDAPSVIQGVEPFGHISKPLNDWGLDPRFVDPCKTVVDDDELVLFTEKLNVKRAHDGGVIILHQDFPYWEPTTPVAHRIATAMLFLDDATRENGCLEVAPGSHLSGTYPQRATDAFGSLEMDPGAFDLTRLQPLEVKAGAVVFFGAFLVHRSLPNRSNHDRRALLYSYQPAGHPHIRDIAPIRRAPKS